MAVDSHTTLEVESLDRIYLKVIQMRLQNLGGITWFFRKHRGEAFATAKVMAEMTRPFVAAIETFRKLMPSRSSASNEDSARMIWRRNTSPTFRTAKEFCSSARLCINGHEYAKRQLDKRGIK